MRFSSVLLDGSHEMHLRLLTEVIQGYWTRFAHSGDPIGGSAPVWPKYTTAGDQDLKLDLPAPATEQGHKQSRCDFWDGLNGQERPLRLFMWSGN